MIWISPVDVVISHLPPETVSGTFIWPVDDFAINTFSVQSVPVTSPVEVLTVICAASQLSKSTSPVLLSILKLSEAATFFILMSPVSPFENIVLQMTSVKKVFPVLTSTESVSLQLTFFPSIFPVVTERPILSA